MHKSKYIDFVSKIPRNFKYLFLITTCSVVFILPNINSVIIEYLTPIILQLLFSITLLFTLGKNELFISDNLLFSKLGTYTYGLYLYHTIIILFITQVFKQLSFSNWYIIGISSFILTILISLSSYHLIEKQFLKLKRYFH